MIIDHIGDFINSRRYSSITTSNPDPIQYPNYYQAIRHEVVLNEGDMLYIPFGWFHHVFSEDVNSNTKVNLSTIPRAKIKPPLGPPVSANLIFTSNGKSNCD